MRIRVRGRLAYVAVSLTYRNQVLHLNRVILDTGSGSSVFSADEVAKIGLLAGPGDQIHRLIGIGGAEYVFSKEVDALALGNLVVSGRRFPRDFRQFVSRARGNGGHDGWTGRSSLPEGEPRPAYGEASPLKGRPGPRERRRSLLNG